MRIHPSDPKKPHFEDLRGSVSVSRSLAMEEIRQNTEFQDGSVRRASELASKVPESDVKELRNRMAKMRLEAHRDTG